MRTSAFVLLVSLLASTISAADIAPTTSLKSYSSIAWHENLSQVKKDQITARRPVLLYITAPGCSYCVKMKSETFSNQSVVGRVQSKFTAVKVDGRKHAEVAKRLKVKLYPTTAIVHSSGAVVDVISGYMGPQDFLKRLMDAEKKLAYQSKLLAAKSRSDHNEVSPVVRLHVRPDDDWGGAGRSIWIRVVFQSLVRHRLALVTDRINAVQI